VSNNTKLPLILVDGHKKCPKLARVSFALLSARVQGSSQGNLVFYGRMRIAGQGKDT
jgi:hypothetical protein